MSRSSRRITAVLALPAIHVPQTKDVGVALMAEHVVFQIEP
ncbi:MULTISPECIES: hypothetical protein [Marinobacter]|nr:hypothetical protein [Marinobacter maritimus]